MLRETSCACNRKLFSKLIYSATQKNLFNSIHQLSSHNVWFSTHRTPLWYHNSHCTPYYKKPDYFLQISQYIHQEIAKSEEREENFKTIEEAKKTEQSAALRGKNRKLGNVESEFSRCSEEKYEEEKKFEEDSENVVSEFCSWPEKSERKLETFECNAAETFSENGEGIGKGNVLFSIIEAVKKTVKGNVIQAPVYKPPVKMTKRVDTEIFEDTKPDEQTRSVTVCKKSIFHQVWKNLKDSRFVNMFIDWKTRYEECDNPIVGGSRFVTNNIFNIISGFFQQSELSQALSEIYKYDPNFDKVTFLQDCETYIIPNILEGMIRGDLDALRDWCHEGSFNMLAEPIREEITAGYHFDSVILDIDNLDLEDGKVVDQGPALVIAFTSQEITCLRDSQGNVVKGDPYKVMRMEHVWTLYRVLNAINSKTAWKLLDSFTVSSSEQFI